MEINLKNIIRAITLIPLALYLVYCAYHLIAYGDRPTYLDCGEIISRSNDEVAIKHGTKTELYLNIQFEKSGFRSIETNPTTYFSKKVGDRVCFNLAEDVSIWYAISNTVGIFVLFILGVIILVLFIGYIVPESWID